MEPELSVAARRHIRALLRALAPAAERLESRFYRRLRKRKWLETDANALLGILPSAAAKHRTLAGFFRQVERQGRELARLNVPPPVVTSALATFQPLLETAMAGRFAPAREQLQLATVLVLNRAFYDVREAEARCFFGLYRAETEAAGLDELLRRFVRLLAHSLRAQTARLLLAGEGFAVPPGGLAYGEGDAAGQGCACVWSYPIRQFAELQLGFAAPRRWLPREETLLRAAADRFAEAFERVRVQAELRRLHAETLRAEEEERRRIARELHDEAGQSLLLLRLELELMERELPAEMRVRLTAARAVAERTIDELRRIVAALSPAVLERLGLEAALRHLSGRFAKMHPATLRMRIRLPQSPFLPEQQRVVYRVAQEALQNISKHSQATRVNFSVTFTDRVIRLRVTDNGAGFCAEQADSKPMAFGLGGMRERAALLGGTLNIRSAQGAGTAVSLVIPYSATVATHGEDSNTHN